MEYSIHNLIGEVTFGEMQSFSNLTVFPTFYNVDNKVSYLSLNIALDNGYVKIGEVSESGTVNNLYVENLSEHYILLLDGEELIGAKQNRVLNSTILLDKKSKTEIPVSCVESGRWSYQSKHFSSSDRIMSSKSKSRKMQDVNLNFERNEGYLKFQADQRRVWNSVDELLNTRKAFSSSSAMSDAFESSRDKMEDYLKSFKYLENQSGFVIAINNKIIGFEYISDPQIFSIYFKKLLRGYVIDALDNQKKNAAIITTEQARNFIMSVKDAKQFNDKSIGLGNSFRFTGENCIAASLIEKDEVIHYSQLYKDTADIEPEEQYGGQSTIRRRHGDGFSSRD